MVFLETMFIIHMISQHKASYQDIKTKTEKECSLYAASLETEYKLKLDEELNRYRQEIAEREEKYKELFYKNEVAKIRSDTLKKSEKISRGFTVENFAPFLQEKYNPTDFRHIGDPVDYLIIDGLTDVNQGVSNEIRGIVLLDIKTGSSKMNKVQRRIRDAVAEGKVSFEIFNPDIDEPEDNQS
jgi:predicted Holliday junction resolvase-like endonuclease